MATKKVKIKVAVFLIVCITLIVGGSAYVSGLYRSSGDVFWLEFKDSVLGVYEGGIVQYLGVPVGKVADISVTADNRAHIKIIIDPSKITLHQGTEAQLVLYSLAAGTMAIELSGGNPEEGRLPPGSEIPARASAFAAISTKIEELMDDAASIIDKVNEGLSGMQSGEIADIVDRAQTVLSEAEKLLVETKDTVTVARGAIEKIDQKVDPVLNEVLALGADLRKTSEEANAFLALAGSKVENLDVDAIAENVDLLLTEISELALQINESVTALDASTVSLLHEADNIEYSFRTTLTEASDTLMMLESLAKQLREDPSSLLRGKGKVKD